MPMQARRLRTPEESWNALSARHRPLTKYSFAQYSFEVNYTFHGGGLQLEFYF